jgi:hypothetical protein
LIATSPLFPPSLELDSIVQPDDSASVASIASMELRSDYEEEGGECQKDDTPLYHHNVDYWRKNVLQDVGRVRHGYGNTRGDRVTGTTGTGTVLVFSTPRHTVYPYHGITGIHGYIKIQ